MWPCARARAARRRAGGSHPSEAARAAQPRPSVPSRPPFSVTGDRSFPPPALRPALGSASGAIASLPAHAGALPFPLSPDPDGDWRRPGLSLSGPGPLVLRAAAAAAGNMAAAAASCSAAAPAGPGPGPASAGPGSCEWLLLRDGCLRCDADGLCSLCYHPALNAILAVTARGAIKVIDGTSGATLQASALNGERGPAAGGGGGRSAVRHRGGRGGLRAGVGPGAALRGGPGSSAPLRVCEPVAVPALPGGRARVGSAGMSVFRNAYRRGRCGLKRGWEKGPRRAAFFCFGFSVVDGVNLSL